MKPYVSTTGSPMYYTARIAKEKYPESLVVFIGPCVAKRSEARRDEAVDYVMTFEEINAIFDGLSIDMTPKNNESFHCSAPKEGKGFGMSWESYRSCKSAKPNPRSESFASIES